jgi:hypothetical protein
MAARSAAANGLIRRLEADNVEGREHVWLFCTYPHELEEEFTIISEFAVLCVDVELDLWAHNAFGIWDATQVVDHTSGGQSGREWC